MNIHVLSRQKCYLNVFIEKSNNVGEKSRFSLTSSDNCYNHSNKRIFFFYSYKMCS